MSTEPGQVRGGLVIEDDMPEIGWRFYDHESLGIYVAVLDGIVVEVTLFNPFE